MAPGMPLTFYTSVTKGLKLKVRKFPGLTSTFVEVTWEKLEIVFVKRLQSKKSQQIMSSSTQGAALYSELAANESDMMSSCKLAKKFQVKY